MIHLTSYEKLQKAYTQQTTKEEVALLGLLIEKTPSWTDWRIQFPFLGSATKPWITDFFEFTTKTVVELDGPNHRRTRAARLRTIRTGFLSEWGFGFISIKASHLKFQESVVSKVNTVIAKRRNAMHQCPFCQKEINPNEPTHDVRSCVSHLTQRLNEERKERLRITELALTVRAELRVHNLKENTR